MTCRHLNTGVVAELIEKLENSVKMKVLETGEIKEVGLATFKRWWKLVEEETKPEALATEQPEAQDALAESQEAQNEPEAPQT